MWLQIQTYLDQTTLNVWSIAMEHQFIESKKFNKNQGNICIVSLLRTTFGVWNDDDHEEFRKQIQFNFQNENKIKD